MTTINSSSRNIVGSVGSGGGSSSWEIPYSEITILEEVGRGSMWYRVWCMCVCVFVVSVVLLFHCSFHFPLCLIAYWCDFP